MRTFYLLLIIVLVGCHANHSEDGQFKIYSDTTSRFGISDHQWHQKLTDAINLSHIDKGIDSFELRLWCDLVITDLKTVTILKYTDSSWKLSETRYWRRLIDNWGKHSELTIDSSVTKRILPQISFDQVIDSIKAFRLDTAITQCDIHNFRDRVADGMFYTIEVSTKGSYRRLSYSNPSHYDDPYDRQISRFLNFMQKNLGAFVLE